jgi:cytochrome P450
MVGDRIPVFEDLVNIPYIRCIMKEVWRWRPPVALGHPHVTVRDISYRGVHIPKGSRIRINSWYLKFIHYSVVHQLADSDTQGYWT